MPQLGCRHHAVKAANNWSSYLRRRFSKTETEARHALLRTIYAEFHEDNDAERRSKLAFSGRLFNQKWQPFRPRKEWHELLLGDPAYACKLGKPSRKPPARMTQEEIEKQTVASCRLEGSTVSIEDVRCLAAAASHAEPPPGFEALAQMRKRTVAELQEAYYHMLALHAAQATVLGRVQFSLTLGELMGIHKVLMRPFPQKSPGATRTVPIQVRQYPLACFPYAEELQGLLPQFVNWLSSPEHVDAHPFLHACDVFLVFSHLHPFADGNGRMARLLASLVMAHSGCAPVDLRAVDRQKYLQHVYSAQHENKVTEFYGFVLDSVPSPTLA